MFEIQYFTLELRQFVFFWMIPSWNSDEKTDGLRRSWMVFLLKQKQDDYKFSLRL